MARNVPQIFTRFRRHSSFMIPWNYSASTVQDSTDIQTERTFLAMFEIQDVGGESEIWNQVNPEQKHFTEYSPP